MAIIRRKLTGRSIYTTDRAHLHILCAAQGAGRSRLVVDRYGLSLITAAGAHRSVAGARWLAPISVAVVFGMLVVTKAFGYAEVVLMAREAALRPACLSPPTWADAGALTIGSSTGNSAVGNRLANTDRVYRRPKGCVKFTWI
ncbi:MAG: hypothetical protein R3C56_41515 [Pirellulaceae bacterium]